MSLYTLYKPVQPPSSKISSISFFLHVYSYNTTSVLDAAFSTQVGRVFSNCELHPLPPHTHSTPTPNARLNQAPFLRNPLSLTSPNFKIKARKATMAKDPPNILVVSNVSHARTTIQWNKQAESKLLAYQSLVFSSQKISYHSFRIQITLKSDTTNAKDSGD